MARPRWGVVATLREPLDLALAFACHHLDLGASVTLFFDDPGDPAAAVLETVTGVRVIRCDAAHWRAMGWARRPAIQTPRQNTNFRRAVAEGLADWLIHLDADEFLWLPEGIEPEIARAGEADWIALPPWERVLTPGDEGMFAGTFRSPLAQGLEAVYGAEAPYLAPRGLAGYASAKPMLPAESPHRAVTHRVTGQDGDPRPAVRAESARILHLEGLTPIHWALKQLRYAAQSDRHVLMRPARYAALRRIIAAEDVRQAALDRFAQTYRLSPQVLAALETRGALHHPTLDPGGAVARHAPGQAFDPSGARLDDSLRPALEAAAAEVTARRAALLAGPG